MKTPHRVNWPPGYEPPQASVSYLNLVERIHGNDPRAVVYAKDNDGNFWEWRVPAHEFGQLFHDLDELFGWGRHGLKETRNIILQYAFANWRDLDWRPV